MMTLCCAGRRLMPKRLTANRVSLLKLVTRHSSQTPADGRILSILSGFVLGSKTSRYPSPLLKLSVLWIDRNLLLTMSLATVSSKILRSARTQFRAEGFRPMTVLSKQSAEEYKKQVG